MLAEKCFGIAGNRRKNAENNAIIATTIYLFLFPCDFFICYLTFLSCDLVDLGGGAWGLQAEKKITFLEMKMMKLRNRTKSKNNKIVKHPGPFKR